MMSQVLAHTDLTIFARISLVIFLVIYFIAVFVALDPIKKSKYKHISENILKD